MYMYMYLYIIIHTCVCTLCNIHMYMYIVLFSYKVISNHSTTQVKRKEQLYENGVGKMIVGHSKM